MKHIRLLLLPLLTLSSMSLSSCTTRRFNSFFNANLLKKFGLDDLPAVSFTNSYYEANNKELKFYFNADVSPIEDYSLEVASYFKNSELTYGAMVDDIAPMFGIPNIFDMLRTRKIVKGITHNKFFYNSGAYYFFYKHSSSTYYIAFDRLEKTVNDRTFSYYLEVSKTSRVRWIEDDTYQEVIIDNNNFNDYFSVRPAITAGGDYAELCFTRPDNIYSKYIDMHVLITYTLQGEEDTYDCLDSMYYDVIVKSGGSYQEGDLVIKSVDVYKESAFILDNTPKATESEDNE